MRTAEQDVPKQIDRHASRPLLAVLFLLVIGLTAGFAHAQNGDPRDATGEAVLRYADGGKKAVANYKRGVLDGRYVHYATSGKPTLQARFKNGVLEGRLQRWTDGGERLEIAGYKAGLLHGTRTLFADDKPTRFESYRDGELIKARGEDGIEIPPIEFLFKNLVDPEDNRPKEVLSPEQNKPEGYPHSLESLLNAIKKLNEVEIKGAKNDEHAAATKRIILHRLIAGVPNYMLDHDPADGDLAFHAAKVCHALGKTTHYPSNPGLPEDVYQKGKQGALQSCLGQMTEQTNDIPFAIDWQLIDPGERNRDGVGHRRWLLAPNLYEIGYGRHELFHAILVVPNLKQEAKFDVLTYPGRGYAPIDLYYTQDFIWSAHPSPDFYQLPKNADALNVQIYRLGQNDKRTEIKINRVHITPPEPTIPGVLFEPVIGKPRHNARYEVQIDGLIPAREGVPKQLIYTVHFVDLNSVK